jgi:hypothetical protein
MNRLIFAFFASLAGLMLASCSIETSASDGDAKIVQTAYQRIADNDEAGFSDLLRDDLKGGVKANFAAFRNELPVDGIKSSRLVRGVQNVSYPNGTSAAELEYEVSDGQKYSIFRAAVADTPIGRRIIALNITRLPASVEEIGGFPLSGKTPKQYVFLAATIASPIAIAVALWLIYRAGTFRRRWLWVVGCLSAICSFKMNWYTGETGVDVLWVQFLGAGVVKAPDPTAPWVLAFGFPLVAIMFFALRPDRNK